MSVWQALGWLGNACFFSRFFVQWWASERAGRSMAPRSFWWLSLTGTAVLGVYTATRGEPVLLAGYVINGGVYLRNLFIGRGARRTPSAAFVVLIGLLATVGLFVIEGIKLRSDVGTAPVWLVVGALGQALWCSRFVLQWALSERRGRSHFPEVFWWISLAGNLLLLAYTLHLGDPIWIVGMLPGPLVQARNLVLNARARDRDQAASSRT